MHPANRVCGEVKTDINFSVEHTEEAFVDVYMEESETVKSVSMNQEMVMTDNALDQYFANKKANKNIESFDDFLAKSASEDRTDQTATSIYMKGSGWGFKAKSNYRYYDDDSVKTATDEISRLITYADHASEVEGQNHTKIDKYVATTSGESLEYNRIVQKKSHQKFNPNFTQIYRITKSDAKITHTGSGRTLGYFTNVEKVYKDSSSSNNDDRYLSLRERSLLYAMDHFGINSTSSHIRISVINNCVNGSVTYYYGNGDTYNGMFKDGKRDGWGKQTFRNGNYYEGYWVNDEIDESKDGEFHLVTEDETSPMFKFNDMFQQFQKFMTLHNLQGGHYTQYLDSLCSILPDEKNSLKCKHKNVEKPFYLWIHKENIPGYRELSSSDMTDDLLDYMGDFYEFNQGFLKFEERINIDYCNFCTSDDKYFYDSQYSKNIWPSLYGHDASIETCINDATGMYSRDGKSFMTREDFKSITFKLSSHYCQSIDKAYAIFIHDSIKAE